MMWTGFFNASSGTPGIPRSGSGPQMPVAGLSQRFEAAKKGLSVTGAIKGGLKPAERALTLAKPWKAAASAKGVATGAAKAATAPVKAAKSIVKKLKFW